MPIIKHSSSTPKFSIKVISAQKIYTENLKLGKRTCSLNSNRAISRKRLFFLDQQTNIYRLVCSQTDSLERMWVYWRLETPYHNSLDDSDKAVSKRTAFSPSVVRFIYREEIGALERTGFETFVVTRGIKYATIKFCHVSHLQFWLFERYIDFEQNIRSTDLSWWFALSQPTGI
jgi:hypothetical protein